MTPLEAVARAIWWPHGTPPAGAWEQLPNARQEPFMASARRALEALREPSEGMVEAGEAISVRDFVPVGQFTTLTWQAMIDAALGEQP